MKKAIRFDNVSKRYVIGQHVTLKRKMADAWDRVTRRGSEEDSRDKYIWAVRNVSFEVMEGETMGLIGPNGSGKSTTLKLLAKITEPDSGNVELQGMVVPLIEVGAGFHSDLSGRDNIYLNGSILGLKKDEIDRQLESIVEFAEIGRFLDTPLKKYSSGMSVRLGFAIAVHINPDVLLVDEVLAVGDVRFQRKCIARMREIVTSGRTVMFVSHNMAAVQALCKRCVLLFDGQVAAYGESQNVTNAYLTNSYNRRAESKSGNDGKVSICSFMKVECQDASGKRIQSVGHGHDLIVAVDYLLSQPIPDVRFAITIHGPDGMTIYETDTCREELVLNPGTGQHSFRLLFPKLALLPGIYSLSIHISDRDHVVFYGWAPNIVDFEVTSDLPDSPVGIVSLPIRWEFSKF